MSREVPKITDGELRVLEVLWEKGNLTASEIVSELQRSANWNRNTTYTFLNRLVEKKVVLREDPGFYCTALYSRTEVEVGETQTFLNRLFEGSLNRMVASFIKSDALSEEEREALRRLIAENTDE